MVQLLRKRWFVGGPLLDVLGGGQTTERPGPRSDTAVGMMPIAQVRRPSATVSRIATRRQEVRPVNAVIALGAPLQPTMERLG
jgi:hypothetical protein